MAQVKKADWKEPVMYDIKIGHGRSSIIHQNGMWVYVFYVSKKKVNDADIGKITIDDHEDLFPVFGYRIYSPAQLRAIANGMILSAQRMEEEMTLEECNDARKD